MLRSPIVLQVQHPQSASSPYFICNQLQQKASTPHTPLLPWVPAVSCKSSTPRALLAPPEGPIDTNSPDPDTPGPLQEVQGARAASIPPAPESESWGCGEGYNQHSNPALAAVGCAGAGVEEGCDQN
eukprot:1162126-Pelagomonas_calceolata.AAC.3